MSDQSNAEKKYLEALQRLIDRNETVSINAVAIEAGMKRGSLRSARYPEVVKEINRVIEVQEAGAIKHKEPKFLDKIDKKDAEIYQLKANYALALQRVVSLERQVIELQNEVEALRKQNDNVRNLR